MPIQPFLLGTPLIYASDELRVITRLNLRTCLRMKLCEFIFLYASHRYRPIFCEYLWQTLIICAYINFTRNLPVDHNIVTLTFCTECGGEICRINIGVIRHVHIQCKVYTYNIYTSVLLSVCVLEILVYRRRMRSRRL